MSIASKKLNIPLLDDYRPDLMRRKFRLQYTERFFKLFSSVIDFEGTVNAEERFIIIKRLWNDGSFSISRSPAPLPQFDSEMDLTFTKYAIEKWDYNIQPLYYRNTPEQSSKAVSTKRLKVGTDGVIVYLNDWARHKPMNGAREMAKRYIDQIVAAKMTIQTNLLLHKMPYLVPCDEEDMETYREVLRQVFSDTPAVFAPRSMKGDTPTAINTNTPYIIDKLESYIVRIENRYLDEIGIDNSKPVSAGQDRLLLDEANANNALIDSFRSSMFDSLNEGFADAEKLFGRHIHVKPRVKPVVSVHEDINGEPKNEEDNKL